MRIQSEANPFMEVPKVFPASYSEHFDFDKKPDIDANDKIQQTVDDDERRMQEILENERGELFSRILHGLSLSTDSPTLSPVMEIVPTPTGDGGGGMMGKGGSSGKGSMMTGGKGSVMMGGKGSMMMGGGSDMIGGKAGHLGKGGKGGMMGGNSKGTRHVPKHL